MRLSSLILPLLVALPSVAEEDPLQVPPEVVQFARIAATPQIGTKTKLQAILGAIFRPVESGGLGITYDNSRTRTVREVWEERKANCLSLTALFVASCKALGIDARYAEPINTNRWRKIGNVIRYERHLVAVIPIPPAQDVVADFLPQLRRRLGAYIVNLSGEDRVRSYFYSNRAVELLDQGNLDEALAKSAVALKVDPMSPSAWNIHGVIQRAAGSQSAAEKAFRHAIRLDPKDSSALGNLEALYRDQGNLTEAARYRQLSQELRKNDPYFNAFLAEEALVEGDLAEAKSRVDTAIKIHTQEPEFHLLRARIHLMEGNTENASRAIEQARKWASPAEKNRYDNKLNAIKRWDREREKGKEEPEEPSGDENTDVGPEVPPLT